MEKNHRAAVSVPAISSVCNMAYYFCIYSACRMAYGIPGLQTQSGISRFKMGRSQAFYKNVHRSDSCTQIQAGSSEYCRNESYGAYIRILIPYYVRNIS